MTGNGQNQKSVGMLDAAFRSTAWNAIIRVTWTHFMEWNTYSSEEVRPFRVQVPFARMDKLPTQEDMRIESFKVEDHTQWFRAD